MTDLLDISTQPAGPATRALMLPPHLERADFWTDEMVARAGMPIHDVPFVSVGGGMGSFVTVDYLRVAGGISAGDIRVLSNISHPWQTYEYLTRVADVGQHPDPLGLLIPAGQPVGFP